MRSQVLNQTPGTLPAILALLLALGASAAGAVNTLFLQDSALAALTDADMGLLMEAIDRGLAAPEGEMVSWENAKTGAKGTVEPGADYEHDGRSCRHLKLALSSKGHHGGGQWNYCRRPGGSWELMPP